MADDQVQAEVWGELRAAAIWGKLGLSATDVIGVNLLVFEQLLTIGFRAGAAYGMEEAVAELARIKLTP